MKTLFTFFLALFVIPCIGQNIDSLKKVASGNRSPQKREKAALLLSDYFSSKNPAEAFLAAKPGLALAVKLNDKPAEGRFLLDIGKAYYLKGVHDSTVYFLNQSVSVLENTKNRDALLEAYRESGKIFIQLKDYKKAAEVYNKIISFSQKAGLRRMMMTTLDQLGKVYEEGHNYRDALKCYRQSLNIKDSLDVAQKVKDSLSVSYNLDFVGDVLGTMKKKSQSEQNLIKTLDTRKSLNDTLAMAINYINLGIVYKGKKQYDKAFEAFQQCLQYATKIKYADLQNSVLNELADLYEQTGNYQQSLVYFKKHRDLDSAVFNNNNSKNIADLQSKYETTQKENQILQQQFEISRRNYWVIGISIILLLSLLLSYSYYVRSRLKQRHIATQAIIETEEKERKRIAQDLHDSVSQIITAAKINLTVLGGELSFKNEEQKKKFEKAIFLVNEGFKEVRTISHNMMPYALLETGLSLVIKQFIENIENDSIKINFLSRGFDEHFDDALETILYRVLQECVNNVMKHASADRLDISLIKDEKSISLTIEDNGKGFDMTDPKRYSGMGLKNMQNRVSFLKGKLELDSHPGRGTLISVYIPVANKGL